MKNTKRNVIVSAILTIALCVSLMVGGTYAWFTDSAKVNVNTIKSGKFDVTLQMLDGEKWVDAEGKTLSFIRTDAEDEDNGLWAPGYKFKLPELRVVNNGNLKLKFNMTFNGSANSKLLEVLKFNVKVDENAPVAVNVGEDILADEVLAAGEMKEVAITGEFPETAGNAYQNLDVTNLAITVVATQLNANEYPTTSPVSSSSETLTITTPVAANGRFGAIQAMKNANITIDADVKALEGSDGGAMAVWADGANAKVVINGGYFTQKITGSDNQYDLIYASNHATIEINGGKFQAKTPKWTLNCKDDGTGAKIIVKGGAFYNFDPSNPDTGDDDIIVPKGYHVEKSGYWYTVYSDDHIGAGYAKVVYGEGENDYAVCKIMTGAYDIKTALKKDNNVVLLGANYTSLALDFPFGENVIVDCNGYNLKYSDGTPVVSKEGLTVLNNGTKA